MKKFIFFITAIVSLFGANIKNNSYFINVGAGSVDIYTSDTVINTKFGYYFYDPNIYKISNRVYIDFNYVNSNADFYITNLKLDWIKNNQLFSPFFGLSIGYLYYNENSTDLSTNIWGVQGGLIVNINNQLNIEASYSWQKAFQKQDIWDKPIKEALLGFTFNF